MSKKQEQMPKHEHKESSHQYDYKAEDARRDAELSARRQQHAREKGKLAVGAEADLLDEIDEILEMTEQTALNFRQQGGQAFIPLPLFTLPNNKLLTALWVSSIILIIWTKQKYGNQLKATLVTGFQRMVEYGRKNAHGIVEKTKRASA